MKLRHALVSLPALLAGCSQEPPSALSDELLATESDFIQVPHAPFALQGGDGEFYLAIRKTSLTERWFLSAFAKQWYPDGVRSYWGDFTLGTRVVSFKQQNDKLFVFDSSEQFKTSDLEDPTVLVEAWPIVELPSFERLSSSDKYVLVDPSAGLNKFGVTGDLFSDPNLGQWGAASLRVGLAFMQSFRKLEDGVTFEEVFNGDFDGDEGLESLWGTLGLTLRHYSEGQGYVPTPDPGVPYYFLSDGRQRYGTNAAVEQNPVKLNVHAGMKPIEVTFTAGALRAQADYPDVDVLGAFQRGVESWNDVFGFPVLKAVFTSSDAIPDDDKSFVLVDYPGGAPFSYADWRSNPNNGEIRGTDIYFSGRFFDDFQYYADDPPEVEASAQESSGVQSLTWTGMPLKQPGCVYQAPDHREPSRSLLKSDTELTAEQKSTRYIQHVMAHEVGHTLGLRHNFAGSLEAPSSSVMDYLDFDVGSVAVAEPGAYDRDAIRYLYGLSPNLPESHAFCTDQDVLENPVCQLDDFGADPLYDWWAPYYFYLESLVLDYGLDLELLDHYLNEVLEFARDTGFVPPEQRVDAIDIALDRTAVPLSDEDATDPAIVATANIYAERVLRRIVLDDWTLRGYVSADVSDPDVIAHVASQAGRMLRNEDKLRTLELRRTTVQVLKRLQADSAFLELGNSRAALRAELDGGLLPDDDAPFVEDLLASIEASLTPYFD